MEMEMAVEIEQMTPSKKNKKDNGQDRAGQGGIRELRNKIKLKA